MSERAPEDGQDDLAVINPDVTITVGGRDVTVHEYGFITGLRVRARSHELVRDLQKAVEHAEILTDDVLDVLARHGDMVRELVAESADVDADFVDGLNQDDGDLLLVTWWEVCSPFFLRQIIRRLEQAADLKNTIDGLTSSLASQQPDTAAPNSSAGTPGAS